MGSGVFDRAGALAIEPGLKTPPDFALHVAEEAMVESAYNPTAYSRAKASGL